MGNFLVVPLLHSVSDNVRPFLCNAGQSRFLYPNKIVRQGNVAFIIVLFIKMAMHMLTYDCYCGSQDSVVRIRIAIPAGGSGVRITAVAINLPLFLNFHTSSGAHLFSYSNCYGRFFRR